MLIVAETIKAQIGHKALCMMGAKDFVGSEKMLRFKLGSGAKNKANYIQITLNANDLYDIEFIKYFPRKLESKMVETYSNVYAMSLNYVIGRATGFAMSL